MARPQAATRPAAPPAPAITGAAQAAKKSGTVTVACKIPNGLVLRLFNEVDYDEPSPAGTIRRKRFDATGEEFTVRGPAVPQGAPPRGFRKPQISGGYALTPNVPLDFWEKWWAQNQRNPVVQASMIFAEPRLDFVRGQARENRARLSGLEPLDMADPEKPDRRAPRSMDPNVIGVKVADEMAERAGGLPGDEDED